MLQDSKQIIKGLPRRIALMLLDCGLIVFCYWLAVMLRFDSGEAYQRAEVLRAMAPMLYYVLPIYMIVFWFGGLYEIMWEYAGMRDLARLTCLSGLATGLIMLFDLFYRSRPISGAVLIFGAVFNTAAIAGVRFLWRLIKTVRGARSHKQENPTPLLIVGAGNAGAWAVNLCKNKNQSFGDPICMVDDDLTKKGLRVQGVPVRGTISDIPELVRKYHIMEIVIAITTVKGDRLSEIINLCNSTHCRVRMLSDPQAVDENGNPVAAGFRELNTADFLSRDEIQLNNAQISEYLHDKVVLVTGGGGSIGSELCRQIMRYQPRRLLIFDIYENCAYELETELRNKYGADAPVITLIGSIRDKERLDEVFDTYHPSVVFHAAAHKHVPLMEISPAEAVKNNVFGTKNLLTSAAEHGVERFVQLSTDKAVNPTNVMGCTKRLCEMLIQSFDGGTDMKCMAVRFGNVLGSHGSVIPLFEEQIKRGGPVTITHPDIVRYFMTITEAAQLVLQAGGLAKGGSIYVLDMGKPVKIMDLANRLIRFYGYEPGVNMQIKITGLRPGEKLYEELLMDTEQDKMRKTAHNKIFIAPPMQIDLADFYNGLQALLVAAHHNDDAVVECLQHMVPSYHPNRRVRADHTVVAMNGNTGLFSKEEIEKQMKERQSENPAKEG
ncbi:polysaccharide biosynthesis protein [Subdoligranulum variabile]|uniref:Polysaccharide biosynthesis protein n=1 Tax=Subdoligranulum variabile DSM 15176 TaxID=411471 RepID=D1PLW6_9FIRM|nr:nucleoside-diphosphate sugar epimerase/dehydratase [Subdoligranulum variabile]EFB76414.1 polysaccharide biosynthesis protein [Subdoligranulum variabile DSM 15176]UWP67846.1 polysaccharide biosynthesis protein [Subdoligranulum variabile]